MKTKYFIYLLFSLFSCTKNEEKQMQNINVFNENEINTFIHFFLQNQNIEDSENSCFKVDRTKFLGNKLTKNSNILDKERWLISNKESDSLISKEDWDFIKLQIQDKNEYFLKQKGFDQKLLNSDSLRKENIKFSEKQGQIIDSLRKYNFEEAKIYMAKTSFEEYYKYIKKSTPIIYFNKPLFFKNRKRIIFSFYTYSGPLNAYSETSIYEFKNGKWFKIKVITMAIS